ncbi:hypothetical protein Ptr86124_008035 [Pyrenophora tritici-repentis]|uniref:DUF2036 multi-domain protein n=1 Tax=Pyrenophora tritici-repentis TaxID=45151 RepID=A0A922NCU9_9PLEO|nr:hypothetical protein Ptr86124_008035 [Pyrenophora tritici-repentis]
MATQQDDGGVPVAIAHEQQHFRLLELPPDIVGLLDASDRPLSPSLSLKSKAPAQTSGTPAYAVLCTPNKTFQLRQIQTSNSLLVTQPILQHHGNDEMPTPATCAIASCAVTLQVDASTASALGLLRDALAVYDIVAGDVDATPNGRSKPNVFADMPVSDGECEAAWTELMAFELDGSSYQPSANALSHVWRAINAAALAEGIPLNQDFLTDDITRPAAEEGHPLTFIQAVLAHLSTDDRVKTGPWSCLDRAKTVIFTGRTLLASKRGADFLIADFTDTWEDRLPEVWRKDAKLSAIEAFYECPSDTTIKAKNTDASAMGRDSAVPAMKLSARKWHDKFAMTRKK